jgi:hypothetical protein
METTKKARIKVFKGLRCDHRLEVAEYYGEYKFLRCEKCKTLRAVKSLSLMKVRVK